MNTFHVHLAISVVKSRPDNLTMEDYIMKLQDAISRGACSNRCTGISDQPAPCMRHNDAISNAKSKSLQPQQQRAAAGISQSTSNHSHSVGKRVQSSHRFYMGIAKTKKDNRFGSTKTLSIYDQFYTAAHKIKSVSSDHGEDIVSKRQCILEGINIVRSIIRAVYNDDGLAISIPTGEFFHDQDLLIPPLLELDLEDLHKALSELLHSILSCISDNISLPEGMGLEDRSVPRPLLVEQFVDLLHLGLQFLLRTAREERCAILPRKNNRSEDRVSSSGLRSTNVGFYFHLLREALTLLHANKKSHQIIFNDFVNLSFVYVGQRIHYFEFAHSDASDIEHQIQASAQANFERTQSRNVQVSSSDSIRLIEILKFLTMIAPSFHQNISDMNFSKVTDQICPTKKIAKRTQMCKERLQRSMAEIALGYTSETESAESDIILTSPKYQLGSGTIETLGIEEWFKRSLWLLVGWGILQSDISYLPSERGSSLQA